MTGLLFIVLLPFYLFGNFRSDGSGFNKFRGVKVSRENFHFFECQNNICDANMMEENRQIVNRWILEFTLSMIWKDFVEYGTVDRMNNRDLIQCKHCLLFHFIHFVASPSN